MSYRPGYDAALSWERIPLGKEGFRIFVFLTSKISELQNGGRRILGLSIGDELQRTYLVFGCAAFTYVEGTFQDLLLDQVTYPTASTAKAHESQSMPSITLKQGPIDVRQNLQNVKF
ncbi:hypothetical protein AJ79_00320 [Helicocarpus griseus UAMH5409]|uniref:Uncharacterized protein n=1 Tax=Helicocarpus griseus UAMH5409 TaxID=1447875 RepID=A0A2B7YBV7_9EURO|nr:hypothetical protein AJ79_00320 [Helicocarpus griseus UAMH5409]